MLQATNGHDLHDESDSELESAMIVQEPLAQEPAALIAGAAPAWLKAKLQICYIERTPCLIVPLPREPESPSLKRAIETLAAAIGTLTSKESGYGAIEEKVQVFAPEITPMQRCCTRIDEKLTRIRRIGVVPVGLPGLAEAAEDTLVDLIGYLGLLCGLRDSARKPRI